MNVSACPSPDRLRRYFADPETGDDAAELGTHIDHCPDCANLLDELLRQDPDLAPWRACQSPPAGRSGELPESLLMRLCQVDSAGAVKPAESDEGELARQLGFGPPSAQGPLGTFGPLHMIERFPSGAMGHVFRAWDERLRRSVAVKFLQPGRADNRRLRERFRFEAASMAQVRNPHVVEIYEVGSTGDSGIPYLVMELIEGGSLKEECERRKALLANSRHARLPREFFDSAARWVLQAARGTAALHQAGLVHRDIKPANILLESSVRTGNFHEDADAPTSATAKLADLGVARDFESHETQLTYESETVGTPAYMSPEQFQDSTQAGYASDVYSLGVVLYELLAGGRPFGGTLAELRRQVLEDFPTPPRSVNRQVPESLDTIAMRCLMKQPGERYKNAAALADDLERYLHHKPIQARAVSHTERLRLWYRRNRALANLGLAAAAVLLVVVTVLSTMSSRKQAELARQADEQRQHAQESFRKTRQVLNDVAVLAANKLADEQFAVADRAEILDTMAGYRLQMLEKVLEHHQRFVRERGNDPWLKQELADTHFYLGELQTSMGRMPQARDSYRAAIAVLDSQLATGTEQKLAREWLAKSYFNLVNVHLSMQEYDEAARCLEQSRIHWAALTRDPSGAAYSRFLALVDSHAGLSAYKRKRYDEALAAYTRSEQAMRGVLENYPDDQETRALLPTVLHNRANLLDDLNRYDEALACCDEEIRLLEELLQARPQDPETFQALAGARNTRGVVLRHMGRIAEAAAEYETTLEMQRRQVARRPGEAGVELELATTLHNYGILLQNETQLEAAIASFRESRAIRDRVLKRQPTNLSLQSSWANTCLFLAECLSDLDQDGEALQIAHKVADQLEASVTASPKGHFLRPWLCQAYGQLGEMYLKLEQPGFAIEPLSKGLAWQRQLRDEAPEGDAIQAARVAAFEATLEKARQRAEASGSGAQKP